MLSNVICHVSLDVRCLDFLCEKLRAFAQELIRNISGRQLLFKLVNYNYCELLFNENTYTN